MTPLEIWIECRRRGITLTVDGDRFTWRGPQDAANRLLPAMRANRVALRECARGLAGLPIEDGPFLPFVPCLTPEQVKEWQKELYDAVTELARLEHWTDEHYDNVVLTVERQSVSTLRPDLAYFRERLAKARTTLKA